MGWIYLKSIQLYLFYFNISINLIKIIYLKINISKYNYYFYQTNRYIKTKRVSSIYFYKIYKIENSPRKFFLKKKKRTVFV